MTVISVSESSVGEPAGVDVATHGFQCGYNGSTLTALMTFFPPTLNKGSLTWNCANNTGNFVVSFINAAFGQATVHTLQDPGVAACNLTTDLGAIAAGTGADSPGSLTGVTETLKFVRAGVTYYIPLYAVNT